MKKILRQAKKESFEDKKKIKNIYKIPIIISIISFVILIFLIPLPFIIFNKTFYYNQYEQNGVYDIIGRNNTQALTFSIFTYFRCNEDALKKIVKNQSETCEVFLKGNYSNNKREFSFTANERSHLSDVRTLIKVSISAVYISFLVFLLSVVFMYISIKRKKEKARNFFNLFTKIIFQSCIILLMIYFLLFLFSLNFNWFFDVFHKIFFPQGNYSFASDSLLIILFSSVFFYNAGKSILLSGLITTIIALIASFALNIIIRKNK